MKNWGKCFTLCFNFTSCTHHFHNLFNLHNLKYELASNYDLTEKQNEAF